MDIKITACTIAKNEALNIAKSIESYKDYVDEIIVVDTGSIDETKEIAKNMGARVLDFEWKNDFSAAKNFAIDNAKGDWILFLDADEWFGENSAKYIKKAIERTDSLKYNAVACKLINFFTETEILETASTIRIFRKVDNIRFCRAIHEALFDTNTNIAIPGLYSEDLIINHSGYMKDMLDRKAKRNKMLLDKNYALGNALPIDYFYGMRENSKTDPVLSEYFYKLIENTPDYDKLVSSFNVGNSIDENKLKVVNAFPNKYSFYYKERLLTEIQEKNPNNPTFLFYEYLLFEHVDKKRAIKALKSAVECEKDFEKNNLSKSNPFYIKKSEVYCLLGEYELFINDKIKALDCFTQSIKSDYTNVNALRGILSIISNEKTEDIVLFINSIYDVSNQEVLRFIVDKLRLLEFNDVFLYYFVDYYKKFNEVDLAFFTSRIITKNFEDVIDTYIKLYKESLDEKALLLIASALICGNCKEKFYKVIEDMTPLYVKILSAYFNDQECENLSENDFLVVMSIFKEIAYIADDATLRKLLNVCKKVKERGYFEAIKYFYSNYSYEKVLNWINYAEDEKVLINDLRVYSNYLKVNIFFRNNEFDKIPDSLDIVIKGGFLEQDVALLCEILEADDDILKTYYDLLDDYIFAIKNISLDKLEDILSDTVKFMTIEKLSEEISDKKIDLMSKYLKVFFEFAKKAKEQKAFAIAEKYYKIALKYNYEMDKCYLALGDIYNRFDKPDLSFYCYQKAFCENLTLSRSILPKNHKNYDYIFSIKEENIVEKCPICGGNSKIISTYINIDDSNLSYNDSMIVKYRCCDDCNHVFAENDIKDKIYWENEQSLECDVNKISCSYDILESLCEITDSDNILCLEKDRGEFETAARNYGFNVEKDSRGSMFDIIIFGTLLNNTYLVYDKLEKYLESLSDDGIAVFRFFDKDNAFSKLANKPLWARAGVKNVFSRQSIDVLFKKFNLQILQIDVDKINKGQIVVFASKE